MTEAVKKETKEKTQPTQKYNVVFVNRDDLTTVSVESTTEKLAEKLGRAKYIENGNKLGHNTLVKVFKAK